MQRPQPLQASRSSTTGTSPVCGLISLARCDAVLRTGLDAAAATLAVLRLEPRPGPLHRVGHRRPPRPPAWTTREILAPASTDGECPVGAAGRPPLRRRPVAAPRRGGWGAPRRRAAAAQRAGPASRPPPRRASRRRGRSPGAARRAGSGFPARPPRRARAPPPCCRAARRPAGPRRAAAPAPPAPLPPASRRAAPPWMATPTSSVARRQRRRRPLARGQRQQRQQQRPECRPGPAPATTPARQPGPVLGAGEGVLHQAEHRGPEARAASAPRPGRRRRGPPAPRRCGAAAGRASRRPPPPGAAAVAADPLPVGAAHQVEGADADEGAAPGARSRWTRKASEAKAPKPVTKARSRKPGATKRGAAARWPRPWARA